MGRLFLGDKVCIVLCCALMLMHSTAERLYFPQETNLTWDAARDYCKMCFKDLVTVIPADTYGIAQNVTSDSWIGLRKYLNSTGNSTGNSTSNGGMPWSRWANGDPLAFQNWYPGWPVFQSPLPKIDCCSCSCTCPPVSTPLMTSFQSTYTTQNVTSFGKIVQNMTNISVTDQNVTDFSQPTASITQNVASSTGWSQSTTAAPTLPVEAACVQTPMPIPDLLDLNKNYIEDSCVAMLSIGAWVERNCMDLLPFICYEDRFLGNVSVTAVTASSAILTWLPGPDNSSFRLELDGDKNFTENLSLNLTYNLDNLTAGSLYQVKVFSVKCGRDIDNPQEAEFYTIPNKVVNLTVTMQQETSVTLSWNRPVGNIDFYRVDYNGTQNVIYTEGMVVTGLTPGTLYQFTVLSGVNDTSQWSDKSIIQVYTKPGKVSNLTVSDITNISLVLSWVPPQGQFTGFTVRVMPENKMLNVTSTSCTIDGLSSGTKVTLSVTAQANHSLDGDTVTTESVTAPGPISSLILSTTDSTLTASWNSSADNQLSFNVVLQPGVSNVMDNVSVSAYTYMFNGLKTANYYTVTVYAVSGNLQSPPVSSSKFTLPSPPTDVKVLSHTRDQIQIQWTPPVNIGTATYSVQVISSFWGQNRSTNVTDRTNCTIGNLTSGTNYQIEVRTLAGVLMSTPATVTQYTVENKIQISLSMMCSSAQPLLCADPATGNQIFLQLRTILNNTLDNSVFWNLQQVTSENLAT